MFVQIVQGLVADPCALRAVVDRWAQELAPEASGWLGTVAGVTEDAMFVGMARFESEEAARRNSNRLEQGLWWAEASKLFAGDVVFHDCQHCLTWMCADARAVGFVRVLQGRVRDPGRVRKRYRRMDLSRRACRTGPLGGAIALHGDGSFTAATYFTSAAAAQEEERAGGPPELEPLLGQESGLLGRVTHYDLASPWLYSPRTPALPPSPLRRTGR